MANGEKVWISEQGYLVPDALRKPNTLYYRMAEDGYVEVSDSSDVWPSLIRLDHVPAVVRAMLPGVA